MLHIGIDGNEANIVNRVGSNQYAYGIMQGLYKARGAGHETTRFTIYLKSRPLDDMPKATKWWRYKVIPPTFAWTQWRLPLELHLPWGRPDVFYSPGHYAPRSAPIPTVVSIMDLAFLKMPNLFLKFKRGTKQLTEWTEYSVKQAAHIIAISENTKKDVVEAYSVKPEAITVAYPGVNVASFKLQASSFKLPDRYVLHLGTLQPRKNIVRLIQAFEKLPPRHKKVELVLAGQSGWLTEDIEAAIEKSPVKDRIIRLGYVTEADKQALLPNASCLAMVGLYEGFGMPPAEAFAAGTVPVVSNNTSLPEVVGDAGILVDPYSVSSIKHGLLAALEESEEKRARRIELGRQHIQKFNWLESAKIVLETLIKVESLK